MCSVLLSCRAVGRAEQWLHPCLGCWGWKCSVPKSGGPIYMANLNYAAAHVSVFSMQPADPGVSSQFISVFPPLGTARYLVPVKICSGQCQMPHIPLTHSFIHLPLGCIFLEYHEEHPKGSYLSRTYDGLAGQRCDSEYACVRLISRKATGV